MNTAYHESDAKGQTRPGGSFNAILKDPNQIHPDEPGAKNPTPFIRYPFYVPDPPNGEDAVRLVPEVALMLPFHRAWEMESTREGRMVTAEEAAPLFAKQELEEKERAAQAKIEADLLIARLKAEKGEIPDPIDPEMNAKVEALEAKITEQDKKLDAILAALSK